MHPRNLIMSQFPVIPPCARPFVLADGNICDDDLTNQILEIIKANNILKKDDNEKDDDPKIIAKKQKAVQSLKFRISTFYNNSQGKSKHPTNGRPIKGLKERITGKEGQLRNNLMGKRALTPETPVLMYNTGLSLRADEIKIGDIVIGDDGSPRTVINTLSGTSAIYKVKQSHGDDYCISSDHILTLKYCGHAIIHWRENLGKNGSWVIKWYDRKTKKVHIKRISVVPPKTKDDALREVEERRDILKINKPREKIIWNPYRKKYGTYRLNYTMDGNKKSIEVAVIPGLTKEQALSDIEKFRSRIDVNPVIDIHVKDYLSLPDSDRRLMLGVKLNTPIKWEHKDVHIDPRILGMWLGDGTYKRPTFTSINEELINYWKYWESNNGAKVTIHDKKDKCIQFGLSSICNYKKPNSNPFTQQLKKYNLINNKHIPEDYIINDTQTRLLVLAGLVDTDGSIENDGTTISISQSYDHKQIIDGAQRIAISLGFRTSVTNKKTSWTNKDGKQHGNALKLVISGSGIENIPTLLPHKKCHSPSKKDMSCCEIKVIENGIGKYYGFEVDKNNRFLLGDATITHNCDYSGRTVIGPDPTLPFGWMAMPKEVAEELTKPEMVCTFNKEYLEKLVNDEKANYIVKSNGTKINLKYAMFFKGTSVLNGDVVIRGSNRLPVINDDVILMVGDIVERDGKIMEGVKVGDIIIRGDERIEVQKENFPLRFGDQLERNGKIVNRKRILTFSSKKYIKLEIGDEIHRHLKDGDLVLLNRQPTLHKGSMLAMRIRICPGKTFRMNLATCKTYNADFDGDEMNVHVPQSLESVAELQELSAAKHNIISAQGSKPNIVIVQDSLTAAFLMTKENKLITKSQFFDISMAGTIQGKPLYSPQKVKTILQILKSKGKKQEFCNGKGLISLLLPEDFIYEKRNDANPDEPVVRIYRGVLYEGALDKTILGASYNSLIQVINKEYGTEIASDFISNIQFITNKWLLVNGFSIGLQDCLINDPESVNRIQDKIAMCYIEAGGIEETTHNPGIREVRITAALSKAKDVGMKIAKDAMSKDNNLLSTVYSGSKGDFFNIAQLTGLLGQQNLLGKRVTPSLNHGKRTLPHYPFGKMESVEEYESRGFVRHSFIEGLNPQEFFFHAMSGREGICDTAMGTAKSGYIQRRIIKVCEDISTKYDGSVRDTTGKIYQMAYGDTGLDPCATVKVGDKQQACDVSRIADRLNLQFEISNEKKIEIKPEKKIEIKPEKKIEIKLEKKIEIKLEKKIEIKPEKKIEVKPEKPAVFNRRIDLLKAIEKSTGKKCLYKGVSDEELLKKLEELTMEE